MTILVVLMLSKSVLAAVFLIAGLAKLHNRSATGNMLIAFSMPVLAVPVLATLLPLAELGVAVGIIVPATAWAAGVVSAFLLLGFSAAIAYNLSVGRRPNCNCFGQVKAAPIGVSTLARNTLLGIPALIVVLSGQSHAGAWRGFGASPLETFAVILGVVCAASLALNVLLAMRLRKDKPGSPGSEHFKPNVPAMTFGLLPGAPAPGFRLRSLSGALTSLEDLLSAGKPVVLIFTSAACPACAELVREISIWQDWHREHLLVVKIGEGPAKAERYPDLSLLQSRREVAEAYRCWGTPGAVLVQRNGTVASQVARGASEIRTLVEEAAQIARDTHAGAAAPVLTKRGLDIGEKVPPLAFVDQHNRSMALSDFAGREVALVFWNPDCGFCQRMLHRLARHDRMRGHREPVIVVISMADGDRNRALGFVSPIVHDEEGRAMNVFGVRGTPTAVLIDRNGHVASGRAAGADAVLSLIGEASTLHGEAGIPA